MRYSKGMNGMYSRKPARTVHEAGGGLTVLILVACFCLGSFRNAPAANMAQPSFVAKVASGELREARASWWGFDEDDSTACLQAAIDSGVPKLIVDKMPSPWVVKPLKAVSNQHIVFESGVVLLAKRGEFRGRTNRLFAVDGVENVRITGYGTVLRMWRDDYANGKDGRGRDYQRGEWRHAMTINGSRNVVVEGLVLEESGGDGIYISAPSPENASRDIVIRDCVCDRNHRQGLSVISAENLLVENCVFKNTKGVAPEDGIDIEPNKASDYFVNCVFRNCVSENNAGNGFEIALSQSRNTTAPCSIRFENCRTIGDNMGIKVRTRCRAEIGDYPTGKIDFAGCTVSKPRYEAVEIMQNPENALKVALADCAFESIGTANPDAPAVMLTSPFPDDPKPAMPEIKGLKWPDSSGRSLFLYDTMNFAALGEEAFPILAAETAGAKVIDLKPGETVPVEPLRFRRHLRLVAYADRPRRVKIRGEHFRVGLNNPIGKPVKVTDLPGNTIAEIPLLKFGSADISFDAPAAGFYSLEMLLGGNAFAVSETDAPLAADCSPWMAGKNPMPQSLMNSEGTLFMPVKAGARAEVRVAGSRPVERVSLTIKDPADRIVFENSAVLCWTHSLTPVAEADGLLKLVFAEPSSGAFEDFYVAVGGVRPFLFFSPEKFWYSL